jgi:hypothetical protein
MQPLEPGLDGDGPGTDTSVVGCRNSVARSLRDSSYSDLRHLVAAESADEVVLSGVVRSYYLKQMAQELVRPALAGRRLRNQVIVISG